MGLQPVFIGYKPFGFIAENCLTQKRHVFAERCYLSATYKSHPKN